MPKRERDIEKFDVTGDLKRLWNGVFGQVVDDCYAQPSALVQQACALDHSRMASCAQLPASFVLSHLQETASAALRYYIPGNTLMPAGKGWLFHRRAWANVLLLIQMKAPIIRAPSAEICVSLMEYGPRAIFRALYEHGRLDQPDFSSLITLSRRGAETAVEAWPDLKFVSEMHTCSVVAQKLLSNCN